MKKTSLLITIIIFDMVPVCMGKVSTKVCWADGNTPLELADPCVPYVYRDIMVGTKLTIIAWSDVAEEWYGGALFLETADMNMVGRLYGRCCEWDECPCSCLPAAGGNAAVYVSYMFPEHPGFELYGGYDPNVGDWFILDYNALDIGDCNIVFYDFDVNETNTLTFYHVPTRDFDKNTKVGFADFSVLASYWQETNCGDVNDCDGADLDTDGNVDVNDLMLFIDYWLYRTDSSNR